MKCALFNLCCRQIAGVVKPNPGQCLLNSSAPLPLYYEHSEEYVRAEAAPDMMPTGSLSPSHFPLLPSPFPSTHQDFPSVAQIYSLMTENDIIPIFACTDDFLPIYEVGLSLLPQEAGVSPPGALTSLSPSFSVCFFLLTSQITGSSPFSSWLLCYFTLS